ncbi:MAG: hypothetical protein ACREJB_18995, partial [Planctomycetaceae bacterium]
SLIAILICLTLSAAVRAEDQNTLPPLRKVLVPADRPGEWPRGDWQPVPIEEFRALVEAARPKPPEPHRVWIEQAEYSATLVDDTLRGGKLTWSVRHAGEGPALLPLGPLDLAVRDLTWPDRAAVWGTSAGGTLSAWIDRPDGTLSGAWALQGRQLSRSVEFQLGLAPAVVSRITLRVPVGRTLRASDGQVRGPEPDGEGWNRWRVELGSGTQCHLTIAQETDAAESEPAVLVESDVRYAVREEGLELEAEIYLEALGAPLTTFALALPAECNVVAIHYGDTPLMWRSADASGDRQRLSVRLPDPLTGRSRIIRVRGLMPARWDQRWRLPQITLPRTTLLSGRLHLSVYRPLVLHDVGTRGCRQTGTVFDPNAGLQMTFDQHEPAAGLSVLIGHPPALLSAAAVARLTLGSDLWTQIAHVRWSVRAGMLFEASCLVADGWEITEARAPQGSSAGGVSHWEVREQPAGRRHLVLEFVDPLAPGRDQVVEIRARRRPQPTLTFPPLRPVGCDALEAFLAVTHSADATARLSETGSFTVTTAEDAPQFAVASPLWPAIAEAPRGRTVFLTGPGPITGGSISWDSADALSRADVWVDAALHRDELTERLTVSAESSASTIDEVLLYVNEPPRGDGERLPRWTFRSGKTRPAAQRLPAG